MTWWDSSNSHGSSRSRLLWRASVGFPALIRDADWYLVQALLILGRRAEAEAMTLRLQEDPGRWQRDARELLLRLAELES